MTNTTVNDNAAFLPPPPPHMGVAVMSVPFLLFEDLQNGSQIFAFVPFESGFSADLTVNLFVFVRNVEEPPFDRLLSNSHRSCWSKRAF